MTVSDQKGQVIYFNRMAEHLTQICKEEMLGKVFWQAFPGAVGSHFHDEFKKAYDEKIQASFEIYLPSKPAHRKSPPILSKMDLHPFKDINIRKIKEKRCALATSGARTIIKSNNGCSMGLGHSYGTVLLQ